MKIIKISRCVECPFLVYASWRDIYICGKSGVELKSLNIIDESCLLENQNEEHI